MLDCEVSWAANQHVEGAWCVVEARRSRASSAATTKREGSYLAHALAALAETIFQAPLEALQRSLVLLVCPGGVGIHELRPTFAFLLQFFHHVRNLHMAAG